MKCVPSFENLLTSAFAGCLIGVLGATALSLACARKYQSTATLEVKPSSSVDLAKEFQAIQGPEVLAEVAAKKSLQGKLPGADRTQNMLHLQKMVSATAIRNTDLIQLRIVATNPKDAAHLANAVAEEYQKFRQITGGARVTIWEYAEPSSKPVFPDLKLTPP